MAATGRRQERLGELIKTTLSEILQEMKDPRLEMVTLTRVELSNDLKGARVFFSVLGDEERQESALEGFKHARGRLQARLHGLVRLRYTPVLDFRYDPAIAGSVRIAQLLKEALGDEAENEGEDAAEETEAEELGDETE